MIIKRVWDVYSSPNLLELIIISKSKNAVSFIFSGAALYISFMLLFHHA